MSYKNDPGFQSASAFAATPESGGAHLVQIAPNRRSVDDKFPILGFTIQTGRLPFFEVLLTTDRELFAPGNAGRRNANNFYASRQDSGLIRADGAEAIYLAPPAVLRGFAQAHPRPTAIYYTLIAYRDASGAGPVFAHAPERLAAEAPSVGLAADFTGQTLSTLLGIPIEHLKPVYAHSYVHTNGAGATTTVGYREYAGAPYPASDEPTWRQMSVDAATDRAEGEDGYAGAQSEFNDFDFLDRQDALSDSFDFDDYQRLPARPLVNGHAGATLIDDSETDYSAGYSADYSADYSDGYEEDYGPVVGAQESLFPYGAHEPAPLSDEEQPYGEDLADEESSYGDGMNADAYAALGDETAYDDSASFAYDEMDESFEAEAADPYGGLEDEYEKDDDRMDSSESHVAAYGADYDDDEAALSFQALDAPPSVAPVPLTIEDKKLIIERIAQFESGRDRYGAINPDGEYEGRFGTNHPAYHRYHIGLSYGLIQFTQDSGLLGRLLTLMRERDKDVFTKLFGADADELIAVTNASGPPSRQATGGRSARVQPVAGADLWGEPWLARFRRAGEHVPFQAAQNQLAAQSFLDPMLRFAGWLGLNTDRALAMVVDRAIQMGRGGAQRWIVSAAGPIQTDAQRQQALAALGYGDLRQFQRATQGLRDDGEFGPSTHAAMVSALGALGAKSPVPIPTREQMMDAMVRHAAGRPWARRVSALRGAGDFKDTPYQI